MGSRPRRISAGRHYQRLSQLLEFLNEKAAQHCECCAGDGSVPHKVRPLCIKVSLWLSQPGAITKSVFSSCKKGVRMNTEAKSSIISKWTYCSIHTAQCLQFAPSSHCLLPIPGCKAMTRLQLKFTVLEITIHRMLWSQ